MFPGAERRSPHAGAAARREHVAQRLARRDEDVLGPIPHPRPLHEELLEDLKAAPWRIVRIDLAYHAAEPKLADVSKVRATYIPMAWEEDFFEQGFPVL